jgi:hypothetical protein
MVIKKKKARQLAQFDITAKPQSQKTKRASEGGSETGRHPNLFYLIMFCLHLAFFFFN